MPGIMITPRAYAYCSGDTSRNSSHGTRKEALGVRTRARKEGKRDTAKITKEGNGSRHEPIVPKRISSISRSEPSQPVIIPTRTSSSMRANRTTSNATKATNIGERHDPRALSPSMAALLAVTHTPRTNARTTTRSDRGRLTANDFRQSVSSTSPKSWNMLQSLPNQSDAEVGHEKETEMEFDLVSVASQSSAGLSNRPTICRSISSESVPSLEIEHELFRSPDSPPLPRTPSSRRGRSPRREKVKMLSSSEPLAEGEMHPLAANGRTMDDADQALEGSSAESAEIEPEIPRVRQGSQFSRTSFHFKSNLTASLRRLTSAARSVSLPSPSMSTVLAINSRVLVNRRSSWNASSPLPLNNPAFSTNTFQGVVRDGTSQQPLAAQLYFSSTPPEEYRAISSIQMQGYLRRLPDEDPLLDKATAPPMFISSSPPPPILLPGINSPRPREPRENSDFLRVVVLEMNMRRAGKLSDVAGRARIWMGPRVDKKCNVKELDCKPAGGTRAERGMGEAVAIELAEAMMVDSDGANKAIGRSVENKEIRFDSASRLVREHGISHGIQTKICDREPVPSRWKASVA